MRGVVALWDKNVAKDECCPAIAHPKELASDQLNAFFVLDVVVVRESDIICLEPVAGTEG